MDRGNEWTRPVGPDVTARARTGDWSVVLIGYEHGFINQTADMMNMLGGKPPVVPMPDFEDAFKTQQVLEAAIVSAEQRSPVKIGDMK